MLKNMRNRENIPNIKTSVKELESNASKIERQINNLKKLSSQHKYGEFWAHCKQVAWMFKTYKLL